MPSVKPYHPRLRPEFARGCEVLYTYQEGAGVTLYDQSGNNRHNTRGATVQWATGPLGLALDNNSDGTSDSPDHSSVYADAFTALIAFNENGRAGSLFFHTLEGADTSQGWFLAYQYAAVNPPRYRFAYHNSGGSRTTLVGSAPDTNPNKIIVVKHAPGGAGAWCNGVRIMTGSYVGTMKTTNYGLKIDDWTGGTSHITSLACTWSLGLPDATCLALSANPLAMFTPARSRTLDVATWAAQAVTPTSNRRRRFFMGAAA